ncbi:hypothetical protein [Mycobacterium riyadhense]|uniref:hypothetical protein n=1 Tax=Mycobacterium riyadhense TaxID=486698 RepID=UPI001958128C|nr:hypothetical protein [Mycobacterium riyadhense]
MPRISDDDQAEGYGIHVPGVWAAVLRAQRDYSAQQVWPYLADPRLVLKLTTAESVELGERARRDAEDRYVESVAAGEAVTVSYALLRGLAPKEFLRQERGTKTFMVFPDDTIEPAELGGISA